MHQHHDMSFWPPAQLADFAMGVCIAALVQRRLREAPAPAEEDAAARGEAWPGWLADVSLGCVVAVVFCAPRPPGTWAMHLNGWEPMLDHGLAPLFVAFLYGSAVSSRSCSVRLLRHEALAGLGAISFEVYIFQRPVHDLFLVFLHADPASMEAFLAYLLSLWFFAGLYARCVQEPFDRWLKTVSSGWSSPPSRDEYVVVGTRGVAAGVAADLPEASLERKHGVDLRLPPL